MLDPARPAEPGRTLPDIPCIDLGGGGAPELVDRCRARVDALMDLSRAHYGARVLRVGDAVTRWWLERNVTPYHAEIHAVARRIPGPGALILNCIYEWSCTAGIGPAPAGGGNRLLRTLDWPVEGLGRAVVVARRDTPAGEVYEVTWPGYVGTLTAMAPGRFSAAINQPPLSRYTGACWIDWALNRVPVVLTKAIAPPHLLRRACETCATFEDARDLLMRTPVAIPVFYSLAGSRADQGCIIERTPGDARVHETPAVITNHWLAFERAGHDRGTDSRGRLFQMATLRDRAADGFDDWLAPPILNWQTRLAVVADAARRLLLVQGFEADGPATRVFNLAEHRCGGRAGTTPAPEAAAPA